MTALTTDPATVVATPFADRHIGPADHHIREMLAFLGYSSLDELTAAAIPESIALDSPLDLLPPVGEADAITELKRIAGKNRVLKSLIGQGYYNTHTPAVILRNVLENPAWYTAYTPYQPEISQGRLELLFYFQTLVCELTGMDVAGASLLDEATAAAEAIAMCLRTSKHRRSTVFVAAQCHPQTIEVVRTRMEPLGIEVELIDQRETAADFEQAAVVLLQYPATDGSIDAVSERIAAAAASGCMSVVATDLLALTLLVPPGQWGADAVVGSSQRFGVPLFFGGPHAAFLATKASHQRSLPGRLVGQSIDSRGQPAFRLALQTREQHIRREKATSNICTAQALLAVTATAYAIYHGPSGLKSIAWRVHRLANRLAESLRAAGYELSSDRFFDTLTVDCGDRTAAIHAAAIDAGFNLRHIDDSRIGLAIDETIDERDCQRIAALFGASLADGVDEMPLSSDAYRSDEYLSQPVFHQYRSETELMRYLRRMADRDLALDRTMIPLGSCTMKLNAAAEMIPISWPEFAQVHPFAPGDQCVGYHELIQSLEAMLCEITGYDAVSLQPNAGAQGEYAALLAIRAYYESLGQSGRNVCLIPSSAHGTNPASAQMAGMRVIVVQCDASGNVDLEDLDRKIAAHPDSIAAIMITYPSTHGVYERHVTQVCDKVHAAGGQVFIDGANLNALVGLAKPGWFGGDVSHLNLHKTFCIPHGGGGPGVGPVAARSHLAAFLPHDPLRPERSGGAVSAAAFGSAGILPISWMYVRMMGAAGLRRATGVAILNANYIAKKLRDKYPILYSGRDGLVAHECIIDTRGMAEHHVSVEDIAKRLVDYGFHAPTMSFPVAGTLMIEPTESESPVELDRFCDAMLAIHREYERVRAGEWPEGNNPLANAPHTLDVMLGEWDRPYSRLEGGCPAGQGQFADKYWPPVGRVDNVYGDRNLMCSCPPVEAYTE